MENRNVISFTFAVLLVMAFGLNEGVRGSAPMLYPAKKEIVIKEGDELRIECKGQGEIQFSRQTLTLWIERSPYTVTRDENSDAYVFSLPNAFRTDTGWYACAGKDVEIENTEQTIEHPKENISWIYVYVNSSEPFAVMEAYYELLVVVVHAEVVIPCRPTSPHVAVELHTDSRGLMPTQPRYDPKIGFIMDKMEKSYSGETFVCRISGFVDNDEGPRYTLHVADPSALEKPVILHENADHVVWGESLTLNCDIHASEGERFSLTWKYPISVLKDRLNIVNATRIGKTGTKEKWRTSLTINNVVAEDAGDYTCTAAHTSASQAVSQEIQVWDPSYKYLNVTVEGDATIVEKQNLHAQWRILIDSFPKEYKLSLYTESGNEIINNLDGKIDPKGKYFYDDDGRVKLLRISELAIEDTGNYTLHVSTPYNNTIVNFTLIVIGAPIVQLIDTKEYYAPGQTVNTSCIVEGSPLPSVTWEYIGYPDFPLKTNPNPINITTFENRHLMGLRFRLKSRASIAFNMTGDLVCRACNQVNCTQSTHQVFIFDVDGFFAIDGPKIVTQGDDIDLKCGASVYNFTENINWRPNDSAKLGEFHSGRFSVTNVTTKFTSQSILHIGDVRKSDSGDYVCEAVGSDGNLESLAYQLWVEDARAPLIETNMNNSEILVDLKKPKIVPLTLECHADGRPPPRLTWHKNNEPIVKNDQFKISDNDSVLKIAYLLDGDSGRYYCNASNRVGEDVKYLDIKITGKSQPQNNVLWISLICVLIVIIILVIACMAVRVHRERVMRKELMEAGLTHFVEGAVECLNPDLTVDDQAELLPYDKKWEFPRELLKLGKQLGSGAFGVVMKAEARGICVEGEVTTVAVKMVRRSADPSYMKALSSELKIMIHLGRHLNVVNLLGACTKTILTKRELYVIVEYCRYGNLHNYLQRHRATFINQIDSATQKIDPNIGMDRLIRSESIGSQNRLKYAALSFSRSISIKSSDSNSGNELVDYRSGTDFVDINMSPDGGVLSNNSVQPGWRSNYRGDYKEQNLKPTCTQDLLCWAWQVARGMDYLSSRNVLHGDLAARNILLADDNIVKICDFGLAKNMYKDDNYKKKGDGPLPIKWMAVESIRDRIFSTQSDVWSYGIVLWEFFTLARTPYPGMEAEKQYDRLIEGYRMEKPEYATDEIYEFMLHCWKGNPSLRPTFPELAEKFGTLLNDSIKLHYLDLNTPYMEMNTTTLEKGHTDYLTMMSSPSHDYHNTPDPTIEVHRPDSAYLSMSPSNKTSEPGIFSPRSDLEESHFDFPPASKSSSINSDSEDCIEAAPMLTNDDDPYLKPIDVRQRRAEFVKQSKQQTPIERDSGYCNVTIIPNPKNVNNKSSEVADNLDESPNSNLNNKNNNKFISPIIHGTDNYVNMPQQKNDPRLKDTVDSFSNPSYVMMAKSDNNSEFV